MYVVNVSNVNVTVCNVYN